MAKPPKKDSAPAPVAAPRTGELRKRLHGYIPLTDSEIDAIWDSGIIAFDTNVVLRLYVVSSATRAAFLNLLDELRERIWLPYHVGTEYLRNRTEKIRSQAKTYGVLKSAINEIKGKLENSKSHPFVDSEVLKEFLAVVEKVTTSLDDECAGLTTLLENDSILDRVDSLFAGRIGEGFDQEQLEKICEVGAVRFQARMPPGYEDRTKPINKFGDLIIWKELIRHAKESGCPVIFVTEDGKEDWWIDEGGRKFAHRDLRQEFKDLSGQLFCLYSMDDFMREAQSRGKKISNEAIEEVKEIAEEERKRAEITDRIESLNAHLLTPAAFATGTGTFFDRSSASEENNAKLRNALLGPSKLDELAKHLKLIYEVSNPLGLTDSQVSELAKQAKLLKDASPWGLSKQTLDDFATHAKSVKEATAFDLDKKALDDFARHAKLVEEATGLGLLKKSLAELAAQGGLEELEEANKITKAALDGLRQSEGFVNKANPSQQSDQAADDRSGQPLD